MRFSVSDFLEGLKINQDYFFKQLNSIGVKNRHVLTLNDIEIIRDNFPINTYVSEQVFKRAKSILEDISL